MNTFFNIQQEFVSVNDRKEVDRQLTRIRIYPLIERIMSRGRKEQMKALLTPESGAKLIKGTRANGCRIFTKYDLS